MCVRNNVAAQDEILRRSQGNNYINLQRGGGRCAAVSESSAPHLPHPHTVSKPPSPRASNLHLPALRTSPKPPPNHLLPALQTSSSPRPPRRGLPTVLPIVVQIVLPFALQLALQIFVEIVIQIALQIVLSMALPMLLPMLLPFALQKASSKFEVHFGGPWRTIADLPDLKIGFS